MGNTFVLVAAGGKGSLRLGTVQMVQDDTLLWADIHAMGAQHMNNSCQLCKAVLEVSPVSYAPLGNHIVSEDRQGVSGGRAKGVPDPPENIGRGNRPTVQDSMGILASHHVR